MDEKKYPVREFKMTEKERCGRMFDLLGDLIKEDNRKAIELIATIIKDEHPSIRFTYNLITKDYFKDTIEENVSAGPRLSIHFCRFSKSMNQPFPRICVDCGKPESDE